MPGAVDLLAVVVDFLVIAVAVDLLAVAVDLLAAGAVDLLAVAIAVDLLAVAVAVDLLAVAFDLFTVALDLLAGAVAFDLLAVAGVDNLLAVPVAGLAGAVILVVVAKHQSPATNNKHVTGVLVTRRLEMSLTPFLQNRLYIFSRFYVPIIASVTTNKLNSGID